ncbi:hypothetical protein KR222_002069, partial [Zaprionus bogoriensis]
AALASLQSSATGPHHLMQQMTTRFRANTNQLKHKFGQAKSLSLSQGD